MSSKKKHSKDNALKRRKERSSAKRIQVQLLEEADILMHQERWQEAMPVLERLRERYPRHPDVLAALLEVSFHLKDLRKYLHVAETRQEMNPNDPILTLSLAGAYLANMRPALALATARKYLSRWPGHPEQGEALRLVADLEPLVAEAMDLMGLTGPDAFQIAVWHEQIQSLLEQGRNTELLKIADQLLQRWPNFVPALNNSSEAHWREGRLDEAIAVSRRVLEITPDNYHALANLSRYLLLNGQPKEARELAERLKTVTSLDPDAWIKKAEALSMLGDDQGVLDAWRDGSHARKIQEPIRTALFAHLAAGANCRLGNEEEARRLWKESLRIAPVFFLAEDNLNDLRQPVQNRHGAWAYSINYLIPKKWLSRFKDQITQPTSKKDDAAVQRETREFLEKHPSLVKAAPHLLDCGDPTTVKFIMNIAMMAETPEMLAVLRDFALGQRGTDDMRMEAVQRASRTGGMPSGPVRIWRQGKWVEILVLGFELHGESLGNHRPPVEALARTAFECLKAGKGVEAERILTRALELSPDAPDLLNNLAMAYRIQGRDKEAVDLDRDIHRRLPDYLFGKVNVAHLKMDEGKLAEAKELLMPLLSRRRFHYSEFAALCQGFMALNLAEGNKEVAKSWLGMWETGDPKHPELPQWKRRLQQPGWLGRLLGKQM